MELAVVPKPCDLRVAVAGLGLRVQVDCGCVQWGLEFEGRENCFWGGRARPAVFLGLMIAIL